MKNVKIDIIFTFKHHIINITRYKIINYNNGNMLLEIHQTYILQRNKTLLITNLATNLYNMDKMLI